MTNPLNAGDVVLSSGKAILTSVVRTFVPLLVGAIIKGLSHINVVLDSVMVEQFVNGMVTAGFAIAYYLIVRLLEVFKSSKFGYLLGIGKAAPVYLAPAAAANVVQPDAAKE